MDIKIKKQTTRLISSAKGMQSMQRFWYFIFVHLWHLKHEYLEIYIYIRYLANYLQNKECMFNTT